MYQKIGLKMATSYSPNFNLPKRAKNKIKFIIIHYTGMKKESVAIKRLQDPKSKVSSHYLIKRNGEKSIYDRNKVENSMRLALRKRKISEDVIDRAVNGISRSLETKGEAEISSSLIGEQVMDALRQIDQIAYVRFASVYRNFSEASDFQKFLGQELDN